MSIKGFFTHKKGSDAGDNQNNMKSHSLEIQRLKNRVKELESALIAKEYEDNQIAMILARW